MGTERRGEPAAVASRQALVENVMAPRRLDQGAAVLRRPELVAVRVHDAAGQDLPEGIEPGEPEQGEVKILVRFDDAIFVAECRGLLHRRQDAAQVFQSLAIGMKRRLQRAACLDAAAQGQHFIGFFGGEPRHDRPPSRAGDEAVFLQAQQGLPDRPLATADLMGEPELGQHGLRRQLVQDDPPLDDPVDQIGGAAELRRQGESLTGQGLSI